MLKPGYKADLILIDLNAAHMIPHYDIVANIVYSAQAADVDTVIIDGQIVMENRRVTQFDEQEVLAKCQALARDLIAR